MAAAVQVPQWDMSGVYPGLQSTEFLEAFDSVIRGIGDLEELFDAYEVGRQAAVTIDDEVVKRFETLVGVWGDLLEQFSTLAAYIRSFVTTDSWNDTAQARLSELQQRAVLLTQLDVRATAWLSAIDVDELIARSAAAADLAYFLQKSRVEASHQMAPAEEALAAELAVAGSSAWSRLHGNVTSQLLVPFARDGEVEVMPISVIRNMAYVADRDIRQRAYGAELEAWARVATPLAAALNSIKGESNILLRRRSWDSALDVALFNNDIDRETLDVMLTAAGDSFPDFRRYLDVKARALGLDRLAWFDLFAPLGKQSSSWDFASAREFLLEQFGTYSQRLRDLAGSAFAERWIDAEPRPGKRDGAFCMSVRPGESRILANYQPTYDGMNTLAHELGHAYHNFNLAERSIFNRKSPMTLAETASTFCEVIVRGAALERAGEEEQIAILESALQDALQVVVDISSRFKFEKGVTERRLRRELSVDELNELMLESQRDTYGEGLDDRFLHPYMWAVKGHYYSAERPFYNFPYMFGLLFGLGLYARYLEDPEAFKTGYDALLSSTGMADAATLAAGFGIDLHSPEFWRSSLDVVRADINRFEALIER